MSVRAGRAAIAAAVLAGGRSRRLGRDKALLELNGETLLERAVRILRQVTPQVIVVGPAGREATVAAPVVADLMPDLGPLAGIYSALLTTAADHLLVVGCDMPFLNPDLLRYLLSIRAEADVVLPIVGCRGQHLHAIYTVACAGPIRRALDAGNRKVDSFFSEVSVRRVEPNELRRLDPGLRSFNNVNTEEDWARAQAGG